MPQVTPSKRLIKGLSYAFPTSGTIRLGSTYTVKRQGKEVRLPMKDDEFTLTIKVKDEAGQWVRHPLDAQLREKHGVDVPREDGTTERKLRRIPVQLAFDHPDLTMAEQYAAFSPQGVPVCVGNGDVARRRQSEGVVSEVKCPGPRYCQFGKANRCDAFMRMLVRVEGQRETDPPFILRTGSVNSVSENRATLEHWHTMYGGRLAGLPFVLVLDAKQSSMSLQSVFYYARLEPAFPDLAAGAQALKAHREVEQDVGVNRAAAEERLLALRANGAFADDASGDEAQFEDLIAGRYSDEVDGEHRTLTVAARPEPTLDVPPAAAAQAAVTQLQGMLTRRASVEASP